MSPPDESGAAKHARVVAVTATLGRPVEVRRLLQSLEQSEIPLHAFILVDNAGDGAIREMAAASPLSVAVVNPGSNLGCGGGLALAERLAMEKYGAELTHLWILDDDAVISPAALGILLQSMETEGADAAHPLVLDANGNLGWFPGLIDREKLRAIQPRQTPEQFMARCGSAPAPFSWAQGIALLVSRRAIVELGFHRTDYLVRGEDLEFSLRITHRFRGIYVPAARVQHLPPEAAGGGSPGDEYAKHGAMLQNIAYTALRLPHGWRIARTIPGNWLRFLRTWKWRPAVIVDAAKVFFRGAVRGLPAGARRGNGEGR